MTKLDIARHLAQWGLRRFPDEDSYYAWQRQALSGERLRLLQETAQARHEAEDADQAFYDLASSPDVLPVIYSQRYDYYYALGPVVADALEGAQRVLDVGCGVGVLTTWYATCFPDVTFLGIDRSLKSIETARRFAQSHQLENVSFHHCEIPEHEIPGTFDAIVATQALFQSESDPGLPSRSWTTFERDRDARQQRGLEERTGIGPRLDRLLPVLEPSGRFVFFEKAVHLGRRVLFQRALEARGCVPVAEPRDCWRIRNSATRLKMGLSTSCSEVRLFLAWRSGRTCGMIRNKDYIVARGPVRISCMPGCRNTTSVRNRSLRTSGNKTVIAKRVERAGDWNMSVSSFMGHFPVFWSE